MRNLNTSECSTSHVSGVVSYHVASGNPENKSEKVKCCYENRLDFADPVKGCQDPRGPWTTC